MWQDALAFDSCRKRRDVGEVPRIIFLEEVRRSGIDADSGIYGVICVSLKPLSALLGGSMPRAAVYIPEMLGSSQASFRDAFVFYRRQPVSESILLTKLCSRCWVGIENNRESGAGVRARGRGGGMGNMPQQHSFVSDRWKIEWL